MIIPYLAAVLWILLTSLIMGLELTEYSIHLDEIRPSIVLIWNLLGAVLFLLVAIKM